MKKQGEFDMKNEKIKLSVLIIILVYLVTTMIAINSKLTGNDIVKLGNYTTIKGNIFTDNNEWFLKTENDTIFLHFGPSEYRESKNIKLSPQNGIELHGYLYENNFAVVNFVYNDSLIEFRDKNGEPLWKKHNNSKPHKKSYVVDAKRCIGCQLCVANCPVNAISMVNGKAVIDADKCINCGICENGNGGNYKGCPVNAISKNY